MNNNTKRIVITPGEPAGIGPDLIIMISQQTWPVEIVVCADPVVLSDRASLLKVKLRLHSYNFNQSKISKKPGDITVLPIKTSSPVIAGKLDSTNSSYVISTLDRACDGCLAGEFSALITGPVHKGIINKNNTPFMGHTEYLAKRSGCNQVVMVFTTESLRVALVTTHLPLSKVSNAITVESIKKIITIINYNSQRYFSILRPCIYVCGLNPHAGEDGYIGHEEIDIIIPALKYMRAQGCNIIGPLPADTIFQKKYLHQADLVLAMYHDQGLPVIKYQGFGNAVNVTLGLPFIRTSVDHGTALELAGSGYADDSSIKTALNLTIKIINNHNEYQ